MSKVVCEDDIQDMVIEEGNLVVQPEETKSPMPKKNPIQCILVDEL